jgi:hypothetical protein
VHINLVGKGPAAGRTCAFPVDGAFHVFTLNWTASGVRLRGWCVDGLQLCGERGAEGFDVPDHPGPRPQTPPASGMPNNANLPTTCSRLCESDATVSRPLSDQC